MVSLAKANLFHEKTKIGISVFGVVISVFLIFMITGVFTALDTMMDDMAKKSGADLWVTSEGSSGSLHSPSFLPVELEARFMDIEGVRIMAPLIRHLVSVELDGEKNLLFLNGYDTEKGLGGPWEIIRGTSTPKDGEIILDRVFASKNGLDIGGRLTIGQTTFKIVGISDKTNMMIGYFAFVTYGDAQPFLLGNLTNYYLIKVDPSANKGVVKKTIEENIPGVSVSTSNEIAAIYKDEVIGAFLPIIFVLVAVGVAVSVLVVGLLVYTLTVDRSREYGILKAIGANNMYLYRMVLTQAMLISMLGFVIGAMVSPIMVYIIQGVVPEFIGETTSFTVFWVCITFLFTGVVASFIPVKKIAKIDPAVVFKG